jgi:hypothetical protein
VIVHLIDGTYELFRHFYGLRRFTHAKGSASRGVDRPYGAVVGVLQTVLQMIDSVKGSASRSPSDAYIGVATDHVIESFRNRLWADYRVKSFASRGFIILFFKGVLCVRLAVGERLRFLHWFLDEFEEAVVGA